MTKQRVQRLVVGLVVILLVASALGYLLVPWAMLGIVGMDSNPQVTFLVRTLAGALLALSPAAWAARAPGRHVGAAQRPDRARRLHVRQFTG
jgi:hypothetical protein